MLDGWVRGMAAGGKGRRRAIQLEMKGRSNGLAGCGLRLRVCRCCVLLIAVAACVLLSVCELFKCLCLLGVGVTDGGWSLLAAR